MNKVLAENLYKALKTVKINKFHNLPILNHAKLEFSNGELFLTSTNLDEVFTAKCSCILNDEWVTCIPMTSKVMAYHDKTGRTTRKEHSFTYSPFIDFVKTCAEYKNVLEFTFNPRIQTLTVKIQGERSTTQFKCIDAQEFPSAYCVTKQG